MLSTRDPPQTKGHIEMESEGLEKDISHKWSTCNAVGKIHWKRDGLSTPVFLGFPCGSASKESAYNTGDLSLISGSGRSAREGIGYPLQYSWASLVVQLVKNLPAMQETWV